MNLNLYDVLKKGICFSTTVILIFFFSYLKCVNICYYDEVWFDLLLMMLMMLNKKEKYFWDAIKIQ